VVGFLDPPLVLVPFLHDASEADFRPAKAIGSAAPAKEICRRRNHKRGIRGTVGQAPAGWEFEIEIFNFVILDPAYRLSTAASHESRLRNSARVYSGVASPAISKLQIRLKT
jgi:hypothetical protein